MVSLKFATRDINLSKDPEKKELLQRVYEKACVFVYKLMVDNFGYTTEDFIWCIAGGFAAYIHGITDKFYDVDIFILCKQPVPIVAAYSIEMDDICYDVLIQWQPGETELEKMCCLLAQFDMDICRRAIIDNGNSILVVSMLDERRCMCEIDMDEHDIRAEMYNDRLNIDFSDHITKWKRIEVDMPQRISFTQLHNRYNKDIILARLPILEDLCCYIANKCKKY